jgi:AcrR family transcriptional regulator
VSDHREMKRNIIEFSKDHFMKYGFFHVSTESIATELGISKKTLYKYFPSKEKLVREIVEGVIKEAVETVEQIVFNKKIEFVDKIKKTMTIIVEQHSKFSDPFIRDLRRTMPSFLKEIYEMRRKATLTLFGHLFKEGIRKKVFKKDLNPEIILMVYLYSMQNIIVPDVLTELSLSASQVYETIIRIIYEGIMTVEARKKYLQNHA